MAPLHFLPGVLFLTELFFPKVPLLFLSRFHPLALALLLTVSLGGGLPGAALLFLSLLLGDPSRLMLCEYVAQRLVRLDLNGVPAISAGPARLDD
jgi:hypothetical protein